MNLNYTDTTDLLERLTSEENLELEALSKRHLISVFDKQKEKVLDIKLPVAFPNLPELDGDDEVFDLSKYTDQIPYPPAPYLLVLLQAGHAALGYFVEGKVVRHKAISAYMVRKKQGKAQLKHLNSKGKSRLGSRIRLQNTIWFFEQINQKIKEWDVMDKIVRIGQSGSPDLWHLLYTSKEEAPFYKHDSRLLRIPVDVQTPNFTELQSINNSVLQSKITVYQDDLPFLDNLGDVIEW